MIKPIKLSRAQRARLPAISDHDRQVIRLYLQHMRDRVERSLNDHRVLCMTDRSKRHIGMVSHLRSQLSTISWLIEVNEQRRRYDPTA